MFLSGKLSILYLATLERRIRQPVDGDSPDQTDQTDDEWADKSLADHDGPVYIVIEPSQPWDGLVEDPAVVECAPPWSEEEECWDEEVRRENLQRTPIQRPQLVKLLIVFLRALRLLNQTFSCHV